MVMSGTGRVTLSIVHLPAVNTPQFEWCETTFPGTRSRSRPSISPRCARAILRVATTGRRERVVGSWNRLLVLAARAVPGMANQFASMGAWEEQLDRRPLRSGREANLYRPVDDEVDFGAHGTLDSRARGFWTPSFLATLPKAARQLAVAWMRSTFRDVRTQPGPGLRPGRSVSGSAREGAEHRSAPRQPREPGDPVAEVAPMHAVQPATGRVSQGR
jgi:hypothetical protein